MAAASGLRQALRPAKRRVFFALRPDPRVRASLAQAALHMHGATQGRCVRDDNIHLTLAFVGAVGQQDLARLLEPPSGVFTSAFVLTLDHCGCWAEKGIGWAAASHTPDGLRVLAENLAGWLRDAGFELDNRPFRPHVTLVRNAQCVPPKGPMAPVEWRIAEFALIESLPMPGGVSYLPLRSWPLR
jgi:2'-5' RNA ligase